LCDNFVWTQKLFEELLRRLSGPEELSLDEYSIIYFEVRCRKSILIRGALVVILCGVNGFSEFLVKLIEVSDEFLSTCRGKIALRVDCDAWVVALVGKEGRDASVAFRALL
jgi:hypothetical protein